MNIKDYITRNRQFLCFCLVGAFSTLLDMMIFYLVRQVVSYNVALICGYCLSLIFNYILTIYWTFGAKSNLKNAAGFVSAHLFNLFVVRMGLMYLFVNQMGMEDKVAYLPTLAISVVTNFIVIKFIVEKTKDVNS